MSNKGNVVCLALLLLVINVYSFGFPPESSKEYHKDEYDLADYLPHVNGRGVVYINKSDENDCYVEMFFYTSMYQIQYCIAFTRHDYKGFSEQISYNDPYVIEGAKRDSSRFFEGKRDEIPIQSGTDIKYVNLALELLNESLLVKGR